MKQCIHDELQLKSKCLAGDTRQKIEDNLLWGLVKFKLKN